ncbi:MAG: tRNA pseudouridine(55) synthase TruB [Holosporaceae bacterium]|jgi:tRNA pseudouridine55 synthase|nr:tRNA pseudouridine(55) synthase TruB [Holosporaceae bacterium]
MKDPKSGWLCLDKPEGISSNLAMLKVRKILKAKTGYIGTLDPFATGVLPIAVGEARKYIKFIDGSEKQYTFTTIFGQTTDSLDKNGKFTEATNSIPLKKDILDVLPEFIGEQKQIPPSFSAIKIQGKRACDRVRHGETLELLPRTVKILDLRMIDENLCKKEATFEVICSKGTYIRSLARDMATKLKSLAYVKELRRTKSGFFSIKNAFSIEKLQKMEDTGEWSKVLTSIESPLDDIPALYLRSENIAKLRNGLEIFVEKSVNGSSNVKIFDDFYGEFFGICVLSDDGLIKPLRMKAND